MSQKIEISIATQTLTFWADFAEAPIQFPISTSKYGIGFEEGTHKTPIGNFRIGEKHGSNESLNTIFKGRVPIGIYDPGAPTESDLVLTRILWLDGLDPDNSNTKSRFIYIHGTNQEHLIGTPASIGCIRMKNSHVAELFDRVSVGCPVSIAEC